jgi:hypothetical protein
MKTLSSTVAGSSTPQQHCDETQGASELKRKHDNAFLTDSASGISAAMSDSVSPAVTATEPATESNLQNSAATDTVVCGVETLAAASKKSKCHDGVHSDDNTSSCSAPVMSDVNAGTTAAAMAVNSDVSKSNGDSVDSETHSENDDGDDDSTAVKKLLLSLLKVCH